MISYELITMGIQGYTGDLKAVIDSMEVFDVQIHRLESVKKIGGIFMADHGNADE